MSSHSTVVSGGHARPPPWGCWVTVTMDRRVEGPHVARHGLSVVVYTQSCEAGHWFLLHSRVWSSDVHCIPPKRGSTVTVRCLSCSPCSHVTVHPPQFPQSLSWQSIGQSSPLQGARPGGSASLEQPGGPVGTHAAVPVPHVVSQAPTLAPQSFLPQAPSPHACF